MKNIKLIVCMFLAAVMLLLPGCFPKALTWSPDGKTAAICTEDGLFFTDSEGKVVSSGMEQGELCRTAWLHDSEHLLVERVVKCKSWSEVEQKVAPEIKATIAEMASEFGKVTQDQQWSDLEAKYGLNDNDIYGIKLYLKAQNDQMSDVVTGKLTGEPEYQIYSIEKVAWKNGQLTVDRQLCQFAEPVWEMYVSGNDKYAVMVTCDMQGESQPVSSLWLLDLEQGIKKLVDTNVAIYPGWMADSRHVVYTRAAGELSDDVCVGNLVMAEVIDEQGKLIDNSPKKTLAGMMMSVYTRVHCLSDGKILFSSIEVNLPVATNDVTAQMQLFVFDTTRSGSVSRVILRDSQEKLAGYDTNFFDVSSNERYVSLVSHDRQVSVFDLVSGEVTEVSPDKQQDELKSLPSWRGASELCYLERGGEKLRVMLLDMVSGKKKCISDSWPDDLIDNIEPK